MNNLSGFIGIFILLGIALLISNNRSKINYRIILWGLGLQWFFAILILKTPIGKPIFYFLDKAITKLISFSDAGSDFLFTSFIPDIGLHSALINFAFRALPTIIFCKPSLISSFTMRYFSYPKILFMSGITNSALVV